MEGGSGDGAPAAARFDPRNRPLTGHRDRLTARSSERGSRHPARRVAAVAPGRSFEASAGARLRCPLRAGTAAQARRTAGAIHPYPPAKLAGASTGRAIVPSMHPGGVEDAALETRIRPKGDGQGEAVLLPDPGRGRSPGGPARTRPGAGLSRRHTGRGPDGDRRVAPQAAAGSPGRPDEPGRALAAHSGFRGLDDRVVAGGVEAQQVPALRHVGR